MRVFLSILLLALAAAVAGAFTLPREITVEREIVIQRPVSTVFTVLSQFRSFERWSPWRELDPDADFEQTGARAGVGARIEWSGDPVRLGTGWQEIVVSEPWQRIGLEVHNGPQGDARVQFLLNGDQLASRVRWQVTVDVTRGQGFIESLLGRYYGLFLRRWLADDMTRGLESLQAYMGTLPATDFSAAQVAYLEVSPIEVASVSGTSSADPQALAAALAAAFQEIADWALVTATPLGGQPLSVSWSSGTDTTRYAAAIPLESPPVFAAPEETRVTQDWSPGGPAVRIIHRGPLSDTLASYQQAEAWAAAQGYRLSGTSWEHYVTDPADTAPRSLETHIYLMVGDDDVPERG